MNEPIPDTVEPEAPAAPAGPAPGPKRREVKYTTIPGFLKDARQLAAGPHKTTGNWSFGQIMQHLSRSINASFDGFGFKMNWFLRTGATLLMKDKMLAGPLPGGYKVPAKGKHLAPEEEVSTEQGLQDLEAAVKRFEQETPSAFHPVFGNLTAEEWTKFHMRHAELHMSFVWPA